MNELRTTSAPSDDVRATGAEAPLIPIIGGFHVKESVDGQSCIDVIKMMYNWRVVIGPTGPEQHYVLNGGWCYFGHGVDPTTGEPRTMQTAYMRAVVAALAWDGVGEPVGYDKVAGA